MGSDVSYRILHLKYKLVSGLICIAFISGLCSCKNKVDIIASQKESLVIELQPLGNVAASEVNDVYCNLKKVYPNIVLNKSIPIPANAYYEPRNRYRADTIIYDLSVQAKKKHVIIALTDKDISTTKNGIKDFGVIGLGYQPGNACVVSSFRLSKNNLKNQLYKVAVHELGHTQGLPHCNVKTCFMRDAEGKNPTDEEKEFCPNCKKVLENKGWQLN